MSFDLLTQSNQSNYLAVVEICNNAASQAAHQVKPQKKISGMNFPGLRQLVALILTHNLSLTC
jgi:hypothetical protein